MSLSQYRVPYDTSTDNRMALFSKTLINVTAGVELHENIGVRNLTVTVVL